MNDIFIPLYNKVCTFAAEIIFKYKLKRNKQWKKLEDCY